MRKFANSHTWGVIQCPNCKATLPDWQTKCQFCQADTGKVARPAAVKYTKSDSAFAVPQWVWLAYYGISVWWMIDGVLSIIKTFADVAAMNAKLENATSAMDRLLLPHPSIFSYFGVVFGVLSIVFGIGLLLRNNTVRGIVNFFSFLKLVIGLCGIVGTLLAGFVFGPWALLFLLVHVFNLFTAAMMIYLIGETDKVSY